MRARIGAIALACAFASLVVAQPVAAGPPGADVGVNVNDTQLYNAPQGVDSVSGTATLDGTWWFDTELEDYDAAVTHATMELSSAYPASDFPCLGVTSFPFVGTPQATLDPGQTYFPGICAFSTLPVSFASGFDVTRSISPAIVPAGGGTQQLTVTVVPRAPTGFYKVQIYSNGVGAIAASSGPANLDHGEALAGGGSNFVLQHPYVGERYTFTFTIEDPALGAPYASEPAVNVNAATGTSSCCSGPTNSLNVFDPILNGEITFSVDQTIASWSINHYPGTAVQLAGDFTEMPTSTDQCKNGGWQTYGIFKNQGDCVSYVATDGKNPPG